MTLRLRDILDMDQLELMLQDGYIRVREHPLDRTLQIFNYTEKAQYEHVWTRETKMCRGLIVRDGVVIARPWSKFFNYGQHAEGTLDLTSPVEVTDKMDGSLGILYEAPDGWAIATRGSFASEQAIHATAVLRERYLPYRDWKPEGSGFTFLFEIVYPGNRIVLDYRDLDDLVLLGAVWNYDGTASGPHDCPEWPGLRTETFPQHTLAEALALPPRKNREGLVVRYLNGKSDQLVKIKQEDYVALHRIVTGLSERTVWEHLAANGGTYTGLLEAIPDEFHGWVTEVATRLIEQHDRIETYAAAKHAELVVMRGLGESRKDYAIAVRGEAPDVAPYCFQILDGRDPSPAIWKAIRPVGSNPMVHTSEDVA